MKKTAITVSFLMFVGVFAFYLFLNKNYLFDKKVTSKKTDLEGYCLFKKGVLVYENDKVFCKKWNSLFNIEEFFHNSIKEGVEIRNISL